MDDTDYRILAHLLQHPLDSTEDIARAVHLTRNAVARRIRLMERSPAALQFFVLPHPSLFAAKATVALYATRGHVDSARLMELDRLLAYNLNHDGLVAATYWSWRGQDPKMPPPELSKALGSQPVAQYTDMTPGPKVAHLSRLQWKVVGALFDSPRASAATLARKTGLSARTCMRHRQALIGSAAVQATVSFEEDRSSGLPVFRAYIQGHPSVARIKAILGPDALRTDTVEEGAVYLARKPSLGGILESIEALRRLPTVTDVKLIMSREFKLNRSMMRRWIDDRLAATKLQSLVQPAV